MNFDELNCYYELILSNFSKYSIQTQAPLDYAIIKITLSAHVLIYQKVYDMCAA